MDVFDKAKRADIMRRVKSKNNKSTEQKLIQLFYENKITGWRRNYPVKGHPDFVFLKERIAVFVDGDFWHARGHEEKPGEQIQTNVSFWSKKLKRNIERDKEVNQALLEIGWLVLRYWDSDVNKNCDGCVKDIMQYLPI